MTLIRLKVLHFWRTKTDKLNYSHDSDVFYDVNHTSNSSLPTKINRKPCSEHTHDAIDEQTWKVGMESGRQTIQEPTDRLYKHVCMYDLSVAAHIVTVHVMMYVLTLKERTVSERVNAWACV